MEKLENLTRTQLLSFITDYEHYTNSTDGVIPSVTEYLENNYKKPQINPIYLDAKAVNRYMKQNNVVPENMITDTIINAFDIVLDRYNISIPDPSRKDNNNDARIVGDTYDELDGKITELLSIYKESVKNECYVEASEIIDNITDEFLETMVVTTK